MTPMQTQPLVSVVIPVYNGENFLTEAIDSVLNQTYPQVEIIVVDDGSTDNTWGIIQSYHHKVHGILKKNGGVASALNRGIQQARGDLIAWLSHDDLFLPEKVEKQVNFVLKNPATGVCYTDFQIIRSDGERLAVIRAPWYPVEELPRRFLRNMHINGSTTMIRKGCFEKAGGFDERLAHTQDLEMWLRMAAIADIRHLPEVLTLSRSHAGQGSLNFERQLDEEQRVFPELYDRYGPERIFPELRNRHESLKQAADRRCKFADELLVSRHWYRFCLTQYTIANGLYPTLCTRLKASLCKLAVKLLGDERESLSLGRRARALSGLGKQAEARRLNLQLFLRHPFRLDALFMWIINWIPKHGLRQLKSFLRRIFQ